MKTCEVLYGFSAMAEDEMFEVNGETAYDPNGNAIPGTGNNGAGTNGTPTGGSKPESKPSTTGQKAKYWATFLGYSTITLGNAPDNFEEARYVAAMNAGVNPNNINGSIR